MEIKIDKNTKLSVIFDAIASGNKCTLVVEKPVETVEKPAETVDNFWGSVKHFKKAEFACKCRGKYCDGYPAEIDKRLVEVLDTLREYSGKPIVISSGLRCKNHNKNVGGVGNSYHMRGRAADFTIRGYSAQTTINLVNTLGLKPLELYAIDSKYVHIAF